jgi:hypothetical protein
MFTKIVHLVADSKYILNFFKIKNPQLRGLFIMYFITFGTFIIMALPM